MYQYKLASELEKFIENELQSSIYYSQLAAAAPNKMAQKILFEFSRDEKSHAESFMQAYYYLTGKIYSPQYEINLAIPGFEEALQKRLAEETTAYKNYGEQYVNAPNKYLSNLFFMIKAVEALHAMRIPILCQECRAT